MSAKQEINIQELSLIDLAYHILKRDSKEPISFKAMFKEVSVQLGLSDDQIKEKIVQFYTDLNIDGRFICVGDNQWGLCEWYPFEKLEDDIVTESAPKRKKSKSHLDEGFDLLEEDVFEEDEYDEDFDEEFEEEEIEDELALDEELAADLDAEMEDVDELDEGFILEDDNELEEEEDEYLEEERK